MTSREKRAEEKPMTTLARCATKASETAVDDERTALTA
jgi:hypothetical protein